MTGFEIVAMCILFIALAIIVWRIVFLKVKMKRNLLTLQANSMSKLKNTLNTMVNGSSTPSEQTLKQMQNKKDKILSKFDTLMRIISDKTGVKIQPEIIHDSFLQKNITINQLPEDSMRGRDSVTIDYFYAKDLINKLLKENKMLTPSEFNDINEIYKKFRKMPKVKK